jgi:hypothetical protein
MLLLYIEGSIPLGPGVGTPIGIDCRGKNLMQDLIVMNSVDWRTLPSRVRPASPRPANTDHYPHI